MSSPEDIIAILVDRLGGEVTIEEHELVSGDIELQACKIDSKFAYLFRTRRRPDQIDGEVIEDREQPRALEAHNG